MKRRDLIRKIEELGCVLVRHGGNHDWYTNPATKKSQPVPATAKSTKGWQYPSFASSPSKTRNNEKDRHQGRRIGWATRPAVIGASY